MNRLSSEEIIQNLQEQGLNLYTNTFCPILVNHCPSVFTLRASSIENEVNIKYVSKSYGRNFAGPYEYTSSVHKPNTHVVRMNAVTINNLQCVDVIYSDICNEAGEEDLDASQTHTRESLGYNILGRWLEFFYNNSFKFKNLREFVPINSELFDQIRNTYNIDKDIISILPPIANESTYSVDFVTFKTIADVINKRLNQEANIKISLANIYLMLSVATSKVADSGVYVYELEGGDISYSLSQQEDIPPKAILSRYEYSVRTNKFRANTNIKCTKLTQELYDIIREMIL